MRKSSSGFIQLLPVLVLALAIPLFVWGVIKFNGDLKSRAASVETAPKGAGPIITSVIPSSANYGDVVAINGSGFLPPGVDVTTLKAYLNMPGGGTYLLASVTPNANNTAWYDNAIQFRITDHIARSGNIVVSVNTTLAYWQTFSMNTSQATPTPSPTATPAPVKVACGANGECPVGYVCQVEPCPTCPPGVTTCPRSCPRVTNCHKVSSPTPRPVPSTAAKPL